MQTSYKNFVSFVTTQFNQLRHHLKRWIHQEIVDDDPCDVDTLFAQDSETLTDPED